MNATIGTISADSFNASYLWNQGFIVSGDARYFGSVFIEDVNNLSIVPDGTTSTDAIQSSSGIDIINIARPDSNGLSNNSYSDFNISSSGLVFNNSSSAVSSSLAGTIAGNPNYAALDSASLILNQITSNNPSYLGGILEVAGDSAAIIIANPNGIVCDACSFANTDKVDLITDTAYSTIAKNVFIYNANIVLSDFNVTTMFFYNGSNTTINADNFNVTAANRFSNYAIINADNFNVAGYNFYNRYGATINANNFNVTLTGSYSYSDFYNSGTIDANDFDVEVEADFFNQDGATINADNFNVTAGVYFYNDDYATINADNFNGKAVVCVVWIARKLFPAKLD